jgi:hypothetical protein
MGALKSDETIDELETLLNLIKNRHAAAGKRTLLFEHGPQHPGAAGACIDHAHVHVIPMRREIGPAEFLSHPIFLQLGLTDWRRLPSIAGLRELNCYASYLWISATNSVDYVTVMRRRDVVASQTLRRWSAEILGVANWNWRVSTKVH